MTSMANTNLGYLYPFLFYRSSSKTYGYLQGKKLSIQSYELTLKTNESDFYIFYYLLNVMIGKTLMILQFKRLTHDFLD